MILRDLANLGYKFLSGIEVSQPKTIIYENSTKIHINNNFSDDEKFDIILMMDVLEHIENDKDTLLQIKSHLNEGGYLFLSVPAYQFLWSAHDEINMHYRRYSRPRIKFLMEKTGFRIVTVSYWNIFVFPVIALIRILRKNSKVKIEKPNKAISFLLYNILLIENYLLKKTDLPFGLSIVASCRNE